MVVKAKQVIGLKIITIQKGKQVDNVEDIIFDPKSNKVKALLVDKGGIFSDAKVILLKDIKSIGKDAVIIDSDEVLKKASDVEKPISNIAKENQYLSKARVITEDGEELGKISDLFFDPQTGEVQYFEVSQGVLRDVRSGLRKIMVSDILTVGEDATIVKGHVTEKFQRQDKTEGIEGSINKSTKSIQEQISEFESVAKTKTGDFAKYIQEKYKEMRKNPKTKKTLEDLKKTAPQLQKEAEDAYRDLKAKLEDVRQDTQNKKRVDDIKKSFERAWEDLKKDIRSLDRRARREYGDLKDGPDAEKIIKDTKKKAKNLGKKAEKAYKDLKKEGTKQISAIGSAGGRSEFTLPRGTTIIPPQKKGEKTKEFVTTKKSKIRKVE